MRWERLFEAWGWLFAEIAKPGVVTGFLFIAAGAALAVAAICGALWLLLRAIRWLMDHQFREAKEHLLERYAIRYGFLGIPRAPLILIAECMALVLLVKILAELSEPFAVVFLSSELSVRVLGLARYDWIVLSALCVLVAVWWWRFCWRVMKHDARIENSRINRSWTRTIRVFARPASALLLLMFLPDLGRFGAAVAADWLKSSYPAFARAHASADEPLLGRNYAVGLQVSVKLAPKERVAGDVGR
ncbi:MAG: hypothetical protein AB7L90_08135 [Hyphomicrobiaceae bacterium]